MSLNFVIESNIPYIRGVFEDMGAVRYLPPEEITAETMRDADALITRTRTRCDAKLLEGSRCSIVASATIGTDHIDIPWCEAHGIEVANAPGCNAPAVAQFVMASLLTLFGDSLAGRTLGIVGVGHVGTIVERWAKALGMRVLLNDPPRAEKEGSESFHSLEAIAAEADAITFHTPLVKSGKYPTVHLADSAFFGTLRRRPVIINSARGAVVDNAALVDALRKGAVNHAVIDCWEGEPAISAELLDLASIATPHIAGYSAQGKMRASGMAAEAVCRHFSLPAPKLAVPIPPPAPLSVTAEEIMASYSPLADTLALKADPSRFEALRNNYRLRKEPGFSAS